LLAKEAVGDVFTWLSQHDDKTLKDALDGLRLKMFTKAEIESLVDGVISDNKESVDRMGAKAFGFVMGLVMKKARGKADPTIVSESIKKKLR
jgi:Glu-tRNA(Gln) amidotransferase subunit E-like FAD-binding protein